MHTVLIDGKPVKVITLAEAAMVLGVQEITILSQMSQTHGQKFRKAPQSTSRLEGGMLIYYDDVLAHKERRKRRNRFSSRLRPSERKHMREWLYVQQAADYLGTSKKCIYRYMDRGVLIEGYNKRNGSALVLRDEIAYVYVHGWLALAQAKEEAGVVFENRKEEAVDIDY